MFKKNLRKIIFPAIISLLVITSMISINLAKQQISKIQYSQNGIPNKWIVVLHPTINAISTSASLNQTYGGNITKMYSSALQGFATICDEKTIQAMANDPRVDFISQDGIIHAVQNVGVSVLQPNPVWNLDRIDQRNLPLNQQYNFETDGNGVTAYIIDTGIRTSHQDFQGRAKYGINTIDGSAVANDDNGHGTHVAGILGSLSYGVAKKVSLVAVKALNAFGDGTISDVIDAVDWINTHKKLPAVVNMSLGTFGSNTALETAITNSINQGLNYAIAAGNDGLEACLTTPARVPNANTVAASDITDIRPLFSNFGTCVDFFAPGVLITSTYNRSDIDSTVLSGTSMAAPHVAGWIALYLTNNPGASPGAVTNALKAAATPGKIFNPGAGTPNLLAYTLFGSAPTPLPNPTPTPLPTPSITPSPIPSPTVFPGAPTRLPDNALTWPCGACQLYSGSFVGGKVENWYLPNGQPFLISSNIIYEIWTRPIFGTTAYPTLDIDLYVEKWNPSGSLWEIYAMSELKDGKEHILTTLTPGYYIIRVYNFNQTKGVFSTWIKK